MMEARVKENCKWSRVTAFAGREYIKKEWRPVPNVARKQAELHPFLDVRIDGKEPVEPDEVVTAVPVATPKKPRKPRRKAPAKKAVKNVG